MKRSKKTPISAPMRVKPALRFSGARPPLPNRTQFFLNEKPDAANSLKRLGEPGRTRTSNPLIKSQLLYH